MATDDEDREYFLAKAQQISISRRLTVVNAKATLALLEALEASQERDHDAVHIDATIAAVTPLLAPALAIALAGTGAPDEVVSLRRAGEMLGLEYRVLGRLVRQGRSPIPVVGANRHPKFLRADVDKLLAGEHAPPPDSPVGLLAEAIRKALPEAHASRKLIRLEDAAARLGLRPGPFHGLARRGKLGLPIVKLGVRFFFRPSDVEAHLAATTTKAAAPPSTNTEQAARSAPARR